MRIVQLEGLDLTVGWNKIALFLRYAQSEESFLCL